MHVKLSYSIVSVNDEPRYDVSEYTNYFHNVLFYGFVLYKGKKKEIPLSVLPKTQQFQSVYSLTPISDISGRYSDYGTD